MDKDNKFSSNIALDSFKIRIPFVNCTLIDKTLIQAQANLRVNTTTGEQLEYNEVKTSTTIVNLRNSVPFKVTYVDGNKEIEVLLNSKHLFENYLDGISQNNIKCFYDLLMSFELFYIKYEDFLNSKISDIDIKKDFYINLESYRKNVNSLYNHSKEKRPLVKKFDNKKEGFGIQFRDRGKLASLNKPFIKIYHKESESKAKDLESISKGLIPFFSSYVDMSKIKDLVRIEGTIKNQKYYRKYFNVDEELTLNNFINKSQDQFHNVFKLMFSNHLNPRIKTPNFSNDLKPAERETLFLMNLIIDKYEVDFEGMLNIYLNQITEDKQQRFRAKQRAVKLYNENNKVYDLKKVSEMNKNANQIFNFIGW